MFNDITEQTNYDCYMNTAPQLPPKTPIRTPVMGTKTIHRRTLSNTSSSQCSNSNRSSYLQIDNLGLGLDAKPEDTDYRVHNFNTTINARRELFQFHSVPYSCDSVNDSLEIPNRMRLYENLNNLQPASMPPSSSSIQYVQTKGGNTFTNAEKRKMFFNTEKGISSSSTIDQENILLRSQFSPKSNIDDSITNDDNMKITNDNCSKTLVNPACSTGSTPQDSFSDDNSSLYLSALSRLRFSPENFLDETLTSFTPTSRIAVANIQRAMAKRTMELENQERS